MVEMSYLRQSDIFNPKNQEYKIVVLGAGSLGSFITLNLAKLGFNNITVYDFDKVELHNIPNQFYMVNSVGKFKVDALKEIVKDFTDVDIVTVNEQITKDSSLPMDVDCLFILTFDTLESRKLVFNILKDRCTKVIDARAGGEEYNIQTINTSLDEELKLWEKSFEITPTELPCGARSIIYTNLSIASEVCNIVKKINNNEIYPRKLIRHMHNYTIINNQKEEKK